MNRYEAIAWIEKAKAIGVLPKTASFRDELFPKQNAFVTDPSQFLVAQCSRRAGKTSGLALRFFQALENHPDSLCIYVALTRESARNIMWGILQETDSRFGVDCTFTESNLTMTHPNGARLQLFGADMKNYARRLKGIKSPGIAIDEAQDFGQHLESLVNDVLTPALADYKDSWLALTGTPGPVPQGYFYDITERGMQGFAVHRWSIFENPYLPNAQAFVDDIKAKRGWNDNEPTLLREWRNQWVLDTNSLLIRYSPSLNHFDELPPGKYNYILGVDFGMKDADALAVIAWSDSSPNIYLVDEIITPNQGISELVNQIKLLQDLYDICLIVADEGALGKKIAEEIRRRHAIPIMAAEKSRKMENIAFLNDYLRLGKFKARSDSRFAQDSYRLQIDWERTTPNRLSVKSSFHSDSIDATLYAFKACPAFAYEPPVKKLIYGTPEWQKREGEQMFDDAMEHFKKKEEEWDGGWPSDY